MKQSVIAIPFVMTFIYVLTLPTEQYIVFGEENKVYSVSINIDNDEHKKEFSQLGEVKIFNWLEKHGYKDELEKMILMSLYPALLSS